MTWPELPLASWRDTYDTLHRWVQIVGKTRLQFAPMQNHWWQTTLYLTSRGLGTSPMPHRAGSFEVEFDFIDHILGVRSSDGETRSVPLRAQSVAGFFEEYLAALRSLNIDPQIFPVPQELRDRLRFDEDTVHRAYDAEHAQRCWQALANTDRVLKTFRGQFLGKSSLSHLWWGSFDIACTRFSGRGAPVHPGGVPNCPDYVTREAYSHECISAGWWPGTRGGFEDPAFYAYAYPEPAGCATSPVAPEGAYYHPQMREWILPYDVVRTAADPDACLLEFLESTYSVAANLGGWDRKQLERP